MNFNKVVSKVVEVSSRFDIGDKLVCLDPIGNLEFLKEYTVHDVRLSSNGIGVIFNDVENKDGYVGFLEHRFEKCLKSKVKLNQYEISLLETVNVLQDGVLDSILKKIK